jgi:hypothetical protein
MAEKVISHEQDGLCLGPLSPQQRRSMMIVLAVALLARLFVLGIVIVFNPHNWLYSRGIEMGLLANSLLHGLGYSSPFGGFTGPTAFIAPGYPTLVAAVFLVFGSYTFASAIVIMLLQTAVSVLTIWWMMQIARETLDFRTAILAGAFWAISLPLLWIPTIFWETSISACAVVGMILFALRARRRPTIITWILMGSCSAAIALINPALLPSLVAILGWLAWQTRKVSRIAPLFGLLALFVVFSPWPIRNAMRFHAFIPLRSTVGFELWMGNRPGSTGFLDESLFPYYNHQELASYVAKGELAYTREKSQQAWAYIRAHPATFLNLSVRRCFRFWMGTGSAGGSPVFVLHAVTTTVLGATGIWLAFGRRRHSFAVLIALPLLLFPLPYYITHAEFRYRLNIDPLMTILAAYAVTQLVSAWSHRRPAIQPPSLVTDGSA